MQRFLWPNSLLFRISNGDFQLRNYLVDEISSPADRLPVVRVVLSYLKAILRAHAFLEQVVVLKIRFVGNIIIY